MLEYRTQPEEVGPEAVLLALRHAADASTMKDLAYDLYVALRTLSDLSNRVVISTRDRDVLAGALVMARWALFDVLNDRPSYRLPERLELGFRATQGVLTLMTLQPCDRRHRNPSGSYSIGLKTLVNEINSFYHVSMVRTPGRTLSDLPPLDPLPFSGVGRPPERELPSNVVQLDRHRAQSINREPFA